MTVKVFTRFNGPVFSGDLLLSLAACKIENSRMNVVRTKDVRKFFAGTNVVKKNGC
jgi:hypothetical protein